MHLSVVCSEDTRWLDGARAAADNATTFLGDSRVRSQLAACNNWVRGSVPADFDSPVRVSTPMLLISGELDPNTPGHWAERAARTLPGARLVELPSVAHNFSSAADCGAGFMAEFFERGTALGLDLSCATHIRPPRFVTELPGR
jgi:pimeloyl-ACP methyl ester carboxylesterase